MRGLKKVDVKGECVGQMQLTIPSATDPNSFTINLPSYLHKPLEMHGESGLGSGTP